MKSSTSAMLVEERTLLVTVDHVELPPLPQVRNAQAFDCLRYNRRHSVDSAQYFRKLDKSAVKSIP